MEPYRVKPDKAGCTHCGQGARWCIVGPDGLSESITYDDKDDAETQADALNSAFNAGVHWQEINQQAPPGQVQ